MAGTCDGIVPAATTNEAFAGGPPGEVNVQIAGAGHLAFSDLCTVDLAAFGEALFAGRDDVNALFLDLLVQLGSDGCPGYAPAANLETCDANAFLDLGTSSAIVRHYATVAFDAALRGEGAGAEAGVFAEAAVEKR